MRGQPRYNLYEDFSRPAFAPRSFIHQLLSSRELKARLNSMGFVFIDKALRPYKFSILQNSKILQVTIVAIAVLEKACRALTIDENMKCSCFMSTYCGVPALLERRREIWPSNLCCPRAEVLLSCNARLRVNSIQALRQIVLQCKSKFLGVCVQDRPLLEIGPFCLGNSLMACRIVWTLLCLVPALASVAI